MDVCQSCKGKITLSDARLVRIDSFKESGLNEITNVIICKYCVGKVLDAMIEIAQKSEGVDYEES